MRRDDGLYGIPLVVTAVFYLFESRPEQARLCGWLSEDREGNRWGIFENLSNMLWPLISHAEDGTCLLSRRNLINLLIDYMARSERHASISQPGVFCTYGTHGTTERVR